MYKYYLLIHTLNRMVNMKKRKLKAVVFPVLYVVILGMVFVTVSLISKNLNGKNDDLDYSVSSIKNDTEPVVKETTPAVIKPILPYVGEGVSLSKDFYNKDDDEQTQQNSLILYENTYLENTGILYTSKDNFNVVSTCEGTIKSTKEDEILGKVVEITCNNNLSTYYYSLSEISVKENDIVNQGQIIGKSGENKIENKEGSSLLFEVYYQGKAMDPNTFYDTDLNTLV
jgi:stage II sporulation protein Q